MGKLEVHVLNILERQTTWIVSYLFAYDLLQMVHDLLDCEDLPHAASLLTFDPQPSADSV